MHQTLPHDLNPKKKKLRRDIACHRLNTDSEQKKNSTLSHIKYKVLYICRIPQFPFTFLSHQTAIENSELYTEREKGLSYPFRVFLFSPILNFETLSFGSGTLPSFTSRSDLNSYIPFLFRVSFFQSLSILIMGFSRFEILEFKAIGV